MTTHSKYSPSRLERIIACPGSVQMCEGIKDTPSIYAQEGTKQHEMVERALDPQTDMEQYLSSLDDEYAEIIRECVNYVHSITNTMKSPFIHREIKVSLAAFGLPEVFGTLDVGINDVHDNTMHIIDWKFGKNVQVFAQNNAQLWAYAAGYTEWPSFAKEITIHIFQPHIHHVDTQTLTVEDLFNWAHGTLAKAIFSSTKKPLDLNAGEKQCRWCPARFNCRERAQLAMRDAQTVFNVLEIGKHKVSKQEMAEIISHWPRLEQAIKDFKLYAKEEIERGRDFPGHKLVLGRPTRKWKDEVATLQWLEENTPIDEMFVSKILSPAQAEKKHRALLKNEAFRELIEFKPGKATLVPESDPRDRLVPRKSAEDLFKQLESVAKDEPILE